MAQAFHFLRMSSPCVPCRPGGVAAEARGVDADGVQGWRPLLCGGGGDARVAFFFAGMVGIFVAAIPRCSLATHLPRWRPRRADCVRGALALAYACGLSGAACLFVLVFAEVVEFVVTTSWACWWCGCLRQRGVVLVSSAALWGSSTCC